MRSRARGPSALSPRRRRALRELRQPSPRPSAPAAARRAYKARVRGAGAGAGTRLSQPRAPSSGTRVVQRRPAPSTRRPQRRAARGSTSRIPAPRRAPASAPRAALRLQEVARKRAKQINELLHPPALQEVARKRAEEINELLHLPAAPPAQVDRPISSSESTCSRRAHRAQLDVVQSQQTPPSSLSSTAPSSPLSSLSQSRPQSALNPPSIRPQSRAQSRICTQRRNAANHRALGRCARGSRDGGGRDGAVHGERSACARR